MWHQRLVLQTDPNPAANVRPSILSVQVVRMYVVTASDLLRCSPPDWLECLDCVLPLHHVMSWGTVHREEACGNCSNVLFDSLVVLLEVTCQRFHFFTKCFGS